jgi:hypothetical protein
MTHARSASSPDLRSQAGKIARTDATRRNQMAFIAPDRGWAPDRHGPEAACEAPVFHVALGCQALDGAPVPT